MDDAQLLALAVEASAQAYAPYSGLAVGAAVLASDGRVFTGANVENASYGLSLCAERAALARAAAEGVGPGDVRAVAASSLPCGACRQWLLEFRVGRVVYPGPEGEPESASPAELLPRAFEVDR